MLFICFLLINGNRKKNKTTKKRMAALNHHIMACKLYTQIRDCLTRESVRTTSLLITSRQLLLYFFMCCANPVMQKFSLSVYGPVLFTYFCKGCSKNFCKFHRNISISYKNFLNKKRLQHSRIFTNFVKCLKEHLWATASFISYIML